MRNAEYERAFSKMQTLSSKADADIRSPIDDVKIDISQPCIIIGGKNGAGKSRLLRSICDEDGVTGIYLDLHHLIEQALMILRSRTDFDAMSDEYDAMKLSDDTVTAIQQIVGRTYSEIDWFSVEVESAENDVAEKFKWGGDQSLFPYFRVTYNGTEYTSLEMGLGEFSVHFLLWILEQHRESKSVTLLLDEPDAYLPPVGVSILLYYLVHLCEKKKWKIILSTHSEEMIRIARRSKLFTLLRADESGRISASNSLENPHAGDSLLSFKGMRRVLFCEDESAYVLTRVLLQADDLSYIRETTIVWGNGHGYLRALESAMPRPPQPVIEFAYVFDGDQRKDFEPSNGSRWPAVFLPTNDDPDTLFVNLATHLDELATALSTPANQLQEFLDTLNGKEPHDWVNDLCVQFGRQQTLASLAALWRELNAEEAAQFIRDVHTALPPTSD